MTDDDFEDILDEMYHYFPYLASDPYAQAEYGRAFAKVNNTGGEEQRAKMQELIDEMTTEREDEEAEQAADAAENEQWFSDQAFHSTPEPTAL